MVEGIVDSSDIKKEGDLRRIILEQISSMKSYTVEERDEAIHSYVRECIEAEKQQQTQCI